MRHAIGLLIVGLLWVTGVAGAQDRRDFVQPYAWRAADLALTYPVGWARPVEVAEPGNLALLMAQTQPGDAGTRPDVVPFITVNVVTLTDPDADLNPLLDSALADIDIVEAESAPITMLGAGAVRAVGADADNTFVGFGRATYLPDNRALVIVGRAITSSRVVFSRTFDTVAGSITLGAESAPPIPTIGTLWYTNPETAPTLQNLTGLVYSGGRLYTVSTTDGLVQFDARNGILTNTFSVDGLQTPTALAADAAGRTYIADTGCNCVHVFSTSPDAETPYRRVEGFSATDAPQSIAVTPAGRLYATDTDGELVFVRVIEGGAEELVSLSPDILEQPLLTLDGLGRVLAMTPGGRVLVFDGQNFVDSFTAQLDGAAPLDIAVDGVGNLLVVTQSRGILVVSRSGQIIDRLGRIVPTAPLPGEIVNPRGIAVSSTGEIFWSDSWNDDGAVTAYGVTPIPQRDIVGELPLDTVVRGVLNTLTPQQRWAFDGTANQRVSLAAIDLSGTQSLDVAVQLLSPSGEEIAYNDDHNGDFASPFDAYIAVATLPVDGEYRVVVDSIDGSGTYALGATDVGQRLNLAAAAATELTGSIEDVFPTQRFVFEGRRGQILTITMQAADGATLDPFLRIYDDAGDLVAFNDDAADPALGTDAQIARVTLERDGFYVLEASRFEGTGAYTLVILDVS